VKLVAQIGIGTICRRLWAKANGAVYPDFGHDGGTALAALSSIKHAGQAVGAWSPKLAPQPAVNGLS